tara:strand:- start:25520 stop:25867 length:348 start_codon:yes stop_codon:yes gene_type:complete
MDTENLRTTAGVPNGRFSTGITIERLFAEFKPVPNPSGTEYEVDGCFYLFTEGNGEFWMVVEALLDTSRKVWSLVQTANALHVGWGYHPDVAVGYLITEIPCPAGCENSNGDHIF